MKDRTQDRGRGRDRGGQGHTDAGALGAAGSGIAAAGAAVVVGACCTSPLLAPLVVGLLGAGGAAWAVGFAPYAPWILAGSGALVAFTFWSVYRPAARCAVSPGAPLRQRLKRMALLTVAWVAGAAWAAALVLNVLSR